MVTAVGPNMSDILTKYSLPTFQHYADAQGYDVHVEQLDEDCTTRKSDAAKAARWQKMDILRRVLHGSDLAVWFDADVLVARSDEDIADNLRDGDFQGVVLHDVPAEDRINPNTGVWVLRNDQRSFEFLDKITEIGMPPGRWADQGAVLHALDWQLGNEQYHGARIPVVQNRFLQGTTYLPTGWNQPHTDDRPNPEAYEGRPLVDDPNAIHFMAMTIKERDLAMGAVLTNIQRNW